MPSRAKKQKRVALVAHCLANQNAKIAELALMPGVVFPVVDLLRENGYVIEQLPCPELLFNGLARPSTTREAYDNPGYRRHCRNLATFTADIVQKYHSEGYEIVLVGLDGSPSSGVRYSGASEPIWGGGPDPHIEGYKTVPGKGIWIEELENELKRRGIPVPRSTGIGMDGTDFNMDKSVEELAQFLRREV